MAFYSIRCCRRSSYRRSLRSDPEAGHSLRIPNLKLITGRSLIELIEEVDGAVFVNNQSRNHD